MTYFLNNIIVYTENKYPFSITTHNRMHTMKTYFLFTVGSVCHIKLFTAGSRNSLKDIRKSQKMPDQAPLLGLRQKQLQSGWKSGFKMRGG
jgi:hypothetical protein